MNGYIAHDFKQSINLTIITANYLVFKYITLTFLKKERLGYLKKVFNYIIIKKKNISFSDWLNSQIAGLVLSKHLLFPFEDSKEDSIRKLNLK